ncbi:MAG: diguanylate cyclase [Xenococcaceae cyanobacterium]
MDDKSISKRLQKDVLVYSALMILAIGVIIALVSILPLYRHLKKDQQRNLVFALKTRTLAIDQYLSRAKEIALQISSRTAIRKKLEAYNRREVSLDELVSFGQPILGDALKKSQEVAGISRLDQTGKLVVQVGLPIPKKFWPIPIALTDAVIWPVPITLVGESYLVVGAPIINNQGMRVGTDIVLFKLENLQQIVQDYTGLGETGETILGTIHNQQVQLFFPLRGNQGHVVHNSSAIGWAIEKAFHKDSGILSPEKFPTVIAYGSITDSNWGLAVRMNPQELYAPVNRQIVVIGSVIFILILLGTGGMVFLLRPLTGKMIIHTDELEQQVEKRTVELKEANAHLRKEISDRQQAEQQLETANQKLKRLACCDSLTNVFNRRHFDENLSGIWRRLLSESSPLSLIMCDVDCFKAYNDTYGHQGGDECLRQVADAISRAVKRSSDFVARYGGEEFVVVLPNTNSEGATQVAEAIRTQVRDLNLPHATSSVSNRVTLSLGVASTIPSREVSPALLIELADRALYLAKNQGRDRVQVYQDDFSVEKLKQIVRIVRFNN